MISWSDCQHKEKISKPRRNKQKDHEKRDLNRAKNELGRRKKNGFVNVNQYPNALARKIESSLPKKERRKGSKKVFGKDLGAQHGHTLGEVDG